MTVKLEVQVRIVGSTSEPILLGGLTIPRAMNAPEESPFGRIPVSKKDVALALRSIADEMDPQA